MKKSSLHPDDSSITESRILPWLLRSTAPVTNIFLRGKVGQELIRTLHPSTLSLLEQQPLPLSSQEGLRRRPTSRPAERITYSRRCYQPGLRGSRGTTKQRSRPEGARENVWRKRERDEESMWETERGQGGEAGTRDKAAAFQVEVAGPGAGLAKWGITIANGHGGNSAGHESPDHTLIGGLGFWKAT